MKHTTIDKNEFELVVADGFKAEYLQDILMLEKECFSQSWQFSDADEYFTEMLENHDNVNVFLRSNNQTIGYVLVRPIIDMVSELGESDAEFISDSDSYYVETIQILPENQGSGGARKLLTKACRIVSGRGMNKFAIHARTTNSLHEKIKKIFEGSITLTRKIESWKWANGEPYEYIEWTYMSPDELVKS